MVIVLPYTRFTIRAQQSSEETRRILAGMVEPKRGWGSYVMKFNKPHKPFEGIVSSSGFELEPIVNYRTPFLPVLDGRFRTSSSGVLDIVVRARLNPLVAVVLVLWLLIVGLCTGHMCIYAASNASRVESLLHGGSMILIVWLIGIADFAVNAGKARRILQNSVRGHLASPDRNGEHDCSSTYPKRKGE